MPEISFVVSSGAGNSPITLSVRIRFIAVTELPSGGVSSLDNLAAHSAVEVKSVKLAAFLCAMYICVISLLLISGMQLKTTSGNGSGIM